MNFEDDELIRQQFADWAADALPFHPRSEINHRAWHAWQVATHLERERNLALRSAIERVLVEPGQCPACGQHVDNQGANRTLAKPEEVARHEAPAATREP